MSRDLRYWNARRESAEVSVPDPDSDVVRFGMTVTIEDEDGKKNSWKIVGEDEADAAHGNDLACPRRWRSRCSARRSATSPPSTARNGRSCKLGGRARRFDLDRLDVVAEEGGRARLVDLAGGDAHDELVDRPLVGRQLHSR